MIAALFVLADGPYANLLGVDVWDQARDARTYVGPWPVVAHPPCHLWVNLAAVNWKRYQRQLPAWYPGGSDGGCFASALASVRTWGGVLEHPAGSHAWKHHGLTAPARLGWTLVGPDEWTCEVWQSAYGHRARKRTWLLYVGAQAQFPLKWDQQPGTHQVGWFDRNKPSLGKRAALTTPTAFRDALLALARSAQDTPQEQAS